MTTPRQWLNRSVAVLRSPWLDLILIVTIMVSLAVGLTANAQATHVAKKQAAYAQNQTVFLQTTFCGLVGPVAQQAQITQPTSPFGQSIGKGAQTAATQLACTLDPVLPNK